MPYSGMPLDVPRDAVYVNLGLTDPTQSLISDQEIDYFLSKNTNDVVRTTVDTARAILFKLSQFSRSRNDMLELYDDQLFQQWKMALTEYISANDPESVTRSVRIALTKANGYAGGISASDFIANVENLDNRSVEPIRELEGYQGENPFLI